MAILKLPTKVLDSPTSKPNQNQISNLKCFRKLYALLFKHQNWKTMVTLLIIFEFIFGLLIISRVKYTEIDWVAYMQEVEGVIVKKQYDYQYLRGDTGPLVYPAGFVYIYSILYYLTGYGENILTGQYIFLGLYLLNLLVVGNIYGYLKVAPVVMMCLVLSKRIHSIFLLRLFNDPVAMLIAYVSLYYFVKQRFKLGTVAFSLALSVKMNVLLFLPGILLTLYLYGGVTATLGHLSFIILFQAILGMPFILTNWRSYLYGAFNLGRQFDYKWTVNWRMVPQFYFNSPEFSKSLLVLHVGLLLAFLTTCWSRRSGGLFKLIWNGFLPPAFSKTQPSAWEVAKYLTVSNLIGITVARSLHYQFYSWYFHTLPFLLLCTAPYYPMLLRVGLLLGTEYAWNRYPSTPFSSFVLLTCHLAILVGVGASDFFHSRQVESSYKED